MGVKKKDFLPQNDQIWPKIGIFVQCRLLRCPVSGSVGGCGARAASRKTPIYFIIQYILRTFFSLQHYQQEFKLIEFHKCPSNLNIYDSCCSYGVTQSP